MSKSTNNENMTYSTYRYQELKKILAKEAEMSDSLDTNGNFDERTVKEFQSSILESLLPGGPIHERYAEEYLKLIELDILSPSVAKQIEDSLVEKGDVQSLIRLKVMMENSQQQEGSIKKSEQDLIKESEEQITKAQENHFKKFALSDGTMLTDGFYSETEKQRAIKKCSKFLVQLISKEYDGDNKQILYDREFIIDIAYNLFTSRTMAEKINMLYADLKIEAGQALEYTVQGARDAANKGLELVTTSMKQIQDLYKSAKEADYKELSKKALQSLADNLTKIGNIVKGMAIAIPLSVVAGLAVAAKTVADMSVRGYKGTEKAVKNLVNIVTRSLEATRHGIGEVIKYTKLDVAYDKSVQTAKYAGGKISQAAGYVGDKASKSAKYTGGKISQAASYVGDKASESAKYSAQKAEAAYKKTKETAKDVASSIGTILSVSKDVLSDKATQALIKVRDTAKSIAEGGKSVTISALKGLEAGLVAVARYMTNADTKEALAAIVEMGKQINQMASATEKQNAYFTMVAGQIYSNNPHVPELMETMAKGQENNAQMTVSDLNQDEPFKATSVGHNREGGSKGMGMGMGMGNG